MPLHVRGEGTRFVQDGLKLAANIGRRRLEVVEPGAETALVELDLGKSREIINIINSTYSVHIK